MIKPRLLVALFVLACVALTATISHAERGVGVNLGRIEVDDLLTPGGGYNLPSIGVINTGSETSTYEVTISYAHEQPQKRPPETWFEFEPASFRLEPGEVQNVDVHLRLPVRAEAGNYFAYLEARAVGEGDTASIGVAAATRLTFAVEPTSWLRTQRIRVNRWLDANQPWTTLVPASLLGALALGIAGKRFRLRIERR